MWLSGNNLISAPKKNYFHKMEPKKNTPEKASALFHATIKASVKNVSKQKGKKKAKK